MNKQVLTIAGIFGLVVLMVLALVLYNNITDNQKKEEVELAESSEYQKALDFVFYDEEKNKVNLLDYEGKLVVLNFWASWCGFCTMEMEGFNNMYNKYIDDDRIKFIMLNVTDGENFSGSEDIATATTYYEENGYDFPIYFDLDLDGTSKYGADSLPLTFFIDPDGNVVAGQKGYLEESMLEQVMKKLEEDL